MGRARRFFGISVLESEWRASVEWRLGRHNSSVGCKERQTPKATMIATAGTNEWNNVKIKIWDTGTGKSLSVIDGTGTLQVYWEGIPSLHNTRKFTA